jgi:hypothetical protein
MLATEDTVYLWGTANYESALIPGELTVIGGFKAVELAAGLAHGLALDEEGAVYSFGCGGKGELGTGSEVLQASTLTKLAMKNVSAVMCHGQISAAVSSCFVYVWGLTNPEELESTSGNV